MGLYIRRVACSSQASLALTSNGQVRSGGLLLKKNFFKHFYLKQRYDERVTNIKYAAVSLTTVRRESCFALSERFRTSPMVTSQNWPMGEWIQRSFSRHNRRDNPPLN